MLVRVSAPNSRSILTWLAIAAVYIVGAKLGLTMAFIAEQVTVVWPPTGLAFAVVAILGFRVWPGVFLGAFIANITSDEPAGTALGIAIGNTLEAVLAVWLLRRHTTFRNGLDRVRDVAGLVVAGAIIGPVVSSTIGVSSLCLGGVQSWELFRTLWWAWWLGDALGALITAPLLLTLFASAPFGGKRRRFEAAILLLGLLLASLTVFGGTWRAESLQSLEYTVFPFSIWAALRFGPVGTAVTTFLMSVTAIWGTSRGLGPFILRTPAENLVYLDIFMAVVSVTSLTLAAAISERREQHALLQAVTEGTVDAVFVKDTAGRYLMINSAGARFLGKPVEQILGRDDSHLFTADTSAKIMELDRYVMRTGATETKEETGTAAGITRTYLSTKGPYRDAEGKVIGIVGIARDVTEEHLVRNALRLSERRYRSLVLATSQVVWRTSTRGDVAEDLPTWTAFTGQSSQDAMGRGWTRMLHPDDVAGVTELWENSLRKGKPYEAEFRVRSTDGTYRHVQGRAVPVMESDGKIREWVGTLTDITDKKHIEEERLQLYELANENNRLKDEFLAMLAHELRNPLAPIRNALAVLRFKPDDAAEKRAREIIDRQVVHLTRLVDDLLDVSRLTRGNIELRTQPIDLRDVARSAIDAVQPAIEARRHRLSVALCEQPVQVEGDATRLEQVCINLLQNAAKYTDVGGSIRLEVRQAQNQAILSVKDSGIGIPANLLPRVFDLFTQADRSLARSEGGLGIGLTIVHKLILMHRGSVEAISAGPGTGTEFVVKLPAVVAPTSGVRVDSVLTKSGRPLRVMVVDDNFDAAEILSVMLSILGHTVRSFHSGPEALAALHEFLPEVVLLDIGLPGMNGYDVAQHIRSYDRERKIQLIAVTGYGQRADQQRAFEAGFDHHLTKPVTPEVLTKLLGAQAARFES
jgi:PAS domain S-box-containing protein